MLLGSFLRRQVYFQSREVVAGFMQPPLYSCVNILFCPVLLFSGPWSNISCWALINAAASVQLQSSGCTSVCQINGSGQLELS
jgi:hypothetical protein